MAEVCYELTDWAADRGLYLSTDMKKKDTTVTALLKHHMYYRWDIQKDLEIRFCARVAIFHLAKTTI